VDGAIVVRSSRCGRPAVLLRGSQRRDVEENRGAGLEIAAMAAAELQICRTSWRARRIISASVHSGGASQIRHELRPGCESKSESSGTTVVQYYR
jgi:hypothetical protein